MLITRLFPMACLLALTATAHAQTAAPAADTARFYRHHLGLTASPVLDGFFRNNRSLPVGLLYKRQTAPNKLWRFGVVLNQNYSRRDEDNPSPPTTMVKVNEEYILNTLGLGASVGRELTKPFSKRWTGTLGADVSAGFSRFTRDARKQSLGNANQGVNPSEYRQLDQFRSFNAAVAPFVGLRYAIRTYLYASAESAIKVYYFRETIGGRITQTDLVTRQIISLTRDPGLVITDQSFRTRFQLINQVTLHCQIGR
ncbi:hypothetical protein BEN47_06040 [Hymenobacter lapidarius]|uniref:Outer membrane protein beta-barrel domain-containing protein n=1 Tax=Hymenobacter lapidarius TaxID=1908237 RepID=A0A1G1SQC0_9BACT|nr:hypothetical protein [Hymenobacter lapidarius]OGX80814.1 hypothetical protein BEN47_06040 [Hymenobacter lapidarius]